MKTKILCSLISILALISCSTKTGEAQTGSKSDNTVATATGNSWTDKYDKIDVKDIPDNIVQLISEDWMLVTAGQESSFNTMTASWGGMGFIWEKPVSFITIRDGRYTYQFLEKEDSFTLSFFTEEYRGALKICGSKSGRDTDKVKEAGLTPAVTPSGLMTFGEARLIVECKKMFVDPISPESFTADRKKQMVEDFYTKETALHTLFISEITNVWIKK